MNAKTKKWLAVWLFWLGIHFVLLFWWGDGWEPNHESYLDIDGDIWPFSGGDLDYDYDISEFLVYTGLPMLIYWVVRLFKEAEEDCEDNHNEDS